MTRFLREYAKFVSPPGVDPDDVLQLVAIELGLKGLNPNLEYWKLAVKHRASDMAKAMRRRVKNEERGFWREYEVNDPAILYERKEEYELALSCLLNIREPYRTTMYLFYAKDLTIKEIMRVLDKPEGTILKRLHTGRRLAKNELETSCF